MHEPTPHSRAFREEWGNPKDKAFYDYIKSYSPVDNIRWGGKGDGGGGGGLVVGVGRWQGPNGSMRSGPAPHLLQASPHACVTCFLVHSFMLHAHLAHLAPSAPCAFHRSLSAGPRPSVPSPHTPAPLPRPHILTPWPACALPPHPPHPCPALTSSLPGPHPALPSNPLGLTCPTPTSWRRAACMTRASATGR